MARRRRDTEAGIFHVTCHSVWTSDLFRDDLDRLDFLTELAATIRKFGWTCICYCLMTTHLHLILEVDQDTLPDGMHRLNTHHACRFNSRHRLRGHVFAGRYNARRILDEAHLIAAFAYDADNPVEAGACKSPADWPWSSYAATVGLAAPCSFVDAGRILRYFGSDRERATARLRAYVEKR